jgi:hypothetical protein
MTSLHKIDNPFEEPEEEPGVDTMIGDLSSYFSSQKFMGDDILSNCDLVNKYPCPHEISNNGNCPLVGNGTSHDKYCIHFSKLTRKGKVKLNSENRPMCKYFLDGTGLQCSQKRSPDHRRVFAHHH